VKYQPDRRYASNDEVMTPPELCRAIVEHFRPCGCVLEPCYGSGNFARELESRVSELHGCEIADGTDFFEFHGRTDWIVTNPPYSQFRRFLQHAMEVADNIVFLVTVNHLWTRARVKDIRSSGFGVCELLLIEGEAYELWPAKSGFELCAAYIRHGYTGPIIVSILDSLETAPSKVFRPRYV